MLFSILFKKFKRKYYSHSLSTQSKNDDIIVKIAKELKVKYFRGQQEIKLKDMTV